MYVRVETYNHVIVNRLNGIIKSRSIKFGFQHLIGFLESFCVDCLSFWASFFCADFVSRMEKVHIESVITELVSILLSSWKETHFFAFISFGAFFGWVFGAFIDKLKKLSIWNFSLKFKAAKFCSNFDKVCYWVEENETRSWAM